MDFGSALLALLVGLVIKGAVMIFGGWLLLKVYRATYGAPPSRPWLLLPRGDLREIRLFWWSLVLFYTSEVTCGIEIYVLFQSNPILSAVHAFTSCTGMGLFALGLWAQLDARVFSYGRRSCVFNRICRGCTVDEAAGCRFRTVLLLVATLVAIACVGPMFASTERMNADTSRFALPFPALNAWYDGTVVPWLKANVPGYRPSGIAYYLPESMLVIEFKLIPLAALAVTLASIVLALKGRVAAAARTLPFAVGLLGYTYFELILYRGTGDVLIGSLGHEVAEFWFLIFTAEYLRHCYGSPASEAAVPAPATT